MPSLPSFSPLALAHSYLPHQVVSAKVDLDVGLPALGRPQAL